MRLLLIIGGLLVVGIKSDPTGYGLGKTPAMGFNSWNQLGCDYDETKVRAVADAMVSTGMLSAGYTYLVSITLRGVSCSCSMDVYQCSRTKMHSPWHVTLPP